MANNTIDKGENSKNKDEDGEEEVENLKKKEGDRKRCYKQFWKASKECQMTYKP